MTDLCGYKIPGIGQTASHCKGTKHKWAHFISSTLSHCSVSLICFSPLRWLSIILFVFFPSLPTTHPISHWPQVGIFHLSSLRFLMFVSVDIIRYTSCISTTSKSQRTLKSRGRTFFPLMKVPDKTNPCWNHRNKRNLTFHIFYRLSIYLVQTRSSVQCFNHCNMLLLLQQGPGELVKLAYC